MIQMIKSAHRGRILALTLSPVLVVLRLVSSPNAAAQDIEESVLCSRRDDVTGREVKPGSNVRIRSECSNQEIEVGDHLSLCARSQAHGESSPREGSKVVLRSTCRPRTEVEVTTVDATHEPEILFVRMPPPANSARVD